MLIVKATESDAKDIWVWRNDVQTREMSLSTEAIDFEAHCRWYHDTLANPNRILYIGRLKDGEKVGMCRFDINEVTAEAEVAINLAPEMRGKRLASPLLSAAIGVFRQSYPMPLIAVIRKNNARSLRCFANGGFVPVAEEGLFLRYLLKP